MNMTKAKSTKKALMASAISLIVCITMLIGTTFAWFTDSVESGRNQIVAGNLDVELYYAVPGDATTASELVWNKVDSDTVIFDENALYEPGYTEMVFFKVENAGTLALKYKTLLDVYAETEGTNVYGETFKLSDYIKARPIMVTEVESALSAQRDYVIPGWLEGFFTKNIDELGTASIGTYSLEPKQSQITGLMLYMPTTVGNEANYKTGTTAPSIEFGINLVATQEQAESDSFGSDYDKDAEFDDIAYAANSAEFATAVKDGADIIALGDNTYTLPAGVSNASYKLVGTGDTVIDLSQAIAQSNNDIVFENLTVKGSTENYKGIQHSGNIVYNNVVFNEATFLYGESVVFNNCTFNLSSQYIWTYGAGEVTFNNCEFNTDGKAILIYNEGAIESQVVNVNNCTFKATGAAYTWDQQHVAAVEIDSSLISGTYTVNLSGTNTYDADFNGFVRIKKDKDPSNVIINDNGTSIEKQFTSSANEVAQAVTVANSTVYLAEGTYTFPASSFAEGVTLNCEEGTVFEGTSSLNINGATVVGATFSSDNQRTVTGTVNGTFKDCTFEGNSGLRYCYAGETVVFENCVFDGAVYGAHFDGGANDVIFKGCSFSGFNAFGGAVTQLTLEDCTFKSTGKSSYNGANLWGNTELKNCTFVFDGTASTEWIGLNGADSKTITFTGCTVTNGDIADYFTNWESGDKVTVDGAEVVKP